MDRRNLKPFYTGIPLECLQRIGETMREGYDKYDQNAWDRFYQKEFTPEDFLEAFNNLIEHSYRAYDEIANGKLHNGAEDHLGHAIGNLIMIMWATENGKLPNKLQVNMSEGNPLLAPTYEDNTLNQDQVEEVLAKEDDTMKTKILKAFNLKVAN